MNNQQMANEQIKKNLNDFLKIQGSVSKERPVKGLIKKETFVKFINNYKYANDRTIVMKNDFMVDFVNFEEPFVQAIEALMALYFTPNQQQLVEWWLYEKWTTEDGMPLQIQNTETGEEINTDTPENLWELLKELK